MKLISILSFSFILFIQSQNIFAGIYDDEINLITEQRNTYLKESQIQLLDLNSINHYLERVMENFEPVHRNLKAANECSEEFTAGLNPSQRARR